MSLNRALKELFRAISDEAARNPEFALRVGDALALYKPPRRRRAAGPGRPVDPAPVPTRPFDLSDSLARTEAPAPEEEVPAAAAQAPPLNPIAMADREGADALRRELAGAEYTEEALAALIAEHNLDPAGLAGGADKAGLIDQIVSQAKKRVERDRALFNY